MRDVVIVSGKRTAIGAYGGTLKDTPLVDLVGHVAAQVRVPTLPVRAKISPNRGASFLDTDPPCDDVGNGHRFPSGICGRSSLRYRRVAWVRFLAVGDTTTDDVFPYRRIEAVRVVEVEPPSLALYKHRLGWPVVVGFVGSVPRYRIVTKVAVAVGLILVQTSIDQLHPDLVDR